MRRIAAISALVLVVAVSACWLPAQNQPSPFVPGNDNPFNPRVEKRAPPRNDLVRAEDRVSAAGKEFVRTLITALEEGLIQQEEADRMVKEVEAGFALKRARIDLMRAASLLTDVGNNASDLSGTEELQRLRQQLQDLEKGIIDAGMMEKLRALQGKGSPPQLPTLAKEPEQPKPE